MLDIDERSETSALLRLSNHGKGESRLAGRLGSKNFDDAAARKSSDAERAVDQNITGRDNIDIYDLVVTQSHDSAVAVLLRAPFHGQIQLPVSSRRHLL